MKKEQWKTAKALMSMEMSKQQLAKLRVDSANQVAKIAELEAAAKTAVANADEEVVRLTIELNDVETRMSEAESRVVGAEAVAKAERVTVASLLRAHEATCVPQRCSSTFCLRTVSLTDTPVRTCRQCCCKEEEGSGRGGVLRRGVRRRD